MYFRQAKRRRLTIDSLNNSNAEIEAALKNHKKEEILVESNENVSKEIIYIFEYVDFWRDKFVTIWTYWNYRKLDNFC